MNPSNIETVETDKNPFGKFSWLKVQKRDGTIGYLRVSSRGGEKDKQFGADGKEVKGE